MTRPRVLVAQLGARRHYAVPRGLAACGCLRHLLTDACNDIAPWKYVPRFLARGKLRSICSRQTTGIPADRIRGYAGFTIRGATVDRRTAGETAADYWVRRNRDFGERVCQADWGDADTVYAFNGSALEVFRHGRQRGLRCILDQTAAPWRYNTQLLADERQRWPGWESSPADLDKSGAMIRREEQEWDLAEVIICGSSFVVKAMEAIGGPVEKCRVVPYPRPIPRGKPSSLEGSPETENRRTGVLFAGTLQLRKGCQYYAAAARKLGNQQFSWRAIGPSNLDKVGQSEFDKVTDYRGPVPRPEVWKHYAWADVFVLPTLSEGSANVCHEAAAAGVPVITTEAAGCRLQALPPGSCFVPEGDLDALITAIKSSSSPRQNAPFSPPQVEANDYGTRLLNAISPVPDR